MSNSQLFPDDIIVDDPDFISIDTWSIIQSLFNHPMKIILLIIGMSVITWFLYNFLRSSFKTATVTPQPRRILYFEHLLSGLFSIFTTLFIVVTTSIIHTPQVVIHNAQEIIPNHDFANARQVNNFFERVPEYKEKLNSEYNPKTISVYEADGKIKHQSETKMHIFVDRATGTTSVRVLAKYDLEQLEVTQKDSVIR